ncbi:MAG: prenyltransferase [Actinomycetota bacterium]|nr:prenyltransferase [Actinomycetota bacterium]MDA2980938.1 prenyltransferase [Actinomycetota bacterium]MDA3002489.1 prenyltransferase [Actinomycetota bacterium]
MSALRTLVLSSRPLSWVNTAFPFGLTYYLFVGEFDAVFVVGSLFFLIPYNVLMYGINDVFDYESDLRNPRKGGVEGALLPPELHRPMLLGSTLLPLPFLVPLVAWGSVVSTGVLALALFFVVAYSAKNIRFKEVPFVDSVTSSLHFVMPAIFATTLVGGELTPLALTLLGSFFFWGMASHAFGAVQDVAADREAGVGSIATVIGAKGTVRFAIGLYVLAGLLLLVTPWPLPLIALVVILYVGALAPWWSVSDEDSWKANRSWRWFLGLNFVAGAVVVLVLFEWWQVTG